MGFEIGTILFSRFSGYFGVISMERACELVSRYPPHEQKDFYTMMGNARSIDGSAVLLYCPLIERDKERGAPVRVFCEGAIKDWRVVNLEAELEEIEKLDENERERRLMQLDALALEFS